MPTPRIEKPIAEEGAKLLPPVETATTRTSSQKRANTPVCRHSRGDGVLCASSQGRGQRAKLCSNLHVLYRRGLTPLIIPRAYPEMPPPRSALVVSSGSPDLSSLTISSDPARRTPSQTKACCSRLYPRLMLNANKDSSVNVRKLDLNA